MASQGNGSNSSLALQVTGNLGVFECSICNCTFTQQYVCFTDGCLHLSCCSCMLHWARTNRTCPVEGKYFNRIYRIFRLVNQPAQDVEFFGDDFFIQLCSGCLQGFKLELLSNHEQYWFCNTCEHIMAGGGAA